MGILNIDLNNINLDNSFDEDDLGTIILIRILACYIKFEKRKELIKILSEELKSVAWHPNRWWNFSVPEDEKKEKIELGVILLMYAIWDSKSLRIVQAFFFPDYDTNVLKYILENI